MEILFDTPHALVPAGGGQRRTLQIAELIRRAGFEIALMDRSESFPLPRRLLAGVRVLLRHGAPPRRSLWTVRAFGLEYLRYRAACARRRGPRLLVWERTRGGGTAAPYAAADAGVRLVAVPQNLESLGDGHRDPMARSQRPEINLRDEVEHLRRAAAVFCISHEERWLLSNCGVPAEVLPYFPVADIESELLRIRSARDPVRPARFLIMGTVGNPPVRAGMIELLRLAGPIARRLGIELHVAGHETESLAGAAGDAVVLHGTVSAQELARLMADARAAIIWQRTGSGALTRIAECLVAGLPVLANGVAARSHLHAPGVHLFESASELEELMAADLPTPPPPARPVRSEARFIDCLQTLAKER